MNNTGRQGDVSIVSFSLAAELAIGTDPLSALRLRIAADKRSVPKAPRVTKLP